MRVRRLSPNLWPLTMALLMLLSSVLANLVHAQDSPHGHYTTLTDACAACHRTHTAVSSRLLRSTDQGNAFCNGCHDGLNALLVSTHGNIATGGLEAPFELECIQCHDPHGSSNLYNIREVVRINPSLGTVGSVSFTSTTGANSYDDGTNSGICVVCHLNPDNPGYPMENHTGGDHGPDMDYRSQDCTTCHLHINGFVHGGGGTGCIECHGHDVGTLYDPDATAPYTPGTTPSQGRGSFQSHSTHTETDPDDARGPGIYCDTCHDINSFPNFNSGTDANGDGRISLAETDVCDTCHSPGGTYDGVGDPVIGAKINWDSGIYNVGNSLIVGKEKWCAGCHDESASVIQGVTAPNVVGDEDANTNYGLGYGFYKTGHGLPVDQNYPASGGTVAGAGISCDYCHDLSMKHFDGVARTYNYTAVEGAPDDYQHGYRLKAIDGQLPLLLPRTGTCADSGVNVSEFRLCLSCHDSGPFIDPNNYDTNFWHDVVPPDPDFNAHNYHLSIMFACDYGPVFQSDWRSHDNDSRASCVTCHNVHGSEQLAMVRDGRLVNRSPGLQVLYYRPGVSFDCFNYPDQRDVSLPESTGTIWNPNVGGLCSTCHGSCGFDTVYYRNIPPQITGVQGQLGSDVLTVDFSEGVYSDVGAAGDLVPADFILTDLDNSRTIIDVTHTAGQNSATLTLSSPLDSTDDIGTDTLAAAAATIYDAPGTPMDTTPVTITGPGAVVQTLALHPSGLDSATACNPVGGSWADILDSNDGDTSYADCYSYFNAPSSELYPAQFTVNMDDPSGLEGATINQLTARAVVNVTSVTGGGGPSGSIAYLQICYNTGGPGQECSSPYDLDGTEGYVEILVGNTVDPDGGTLDLNDLNNLNVEVRLNADDCCGDADATAYVTEVYAEMDYTLPTDFEPPTLFNQSPINGATGINVTSNLTFTLSDSDSGVDWTTFEIQLSGSKGYSKLYTDADFFTVFKTGTAASYSVTVNPDDNFGGEEVITVTVRVDDYAGNALAPSAWSFTTAPAPIPQTLILHPSGVITNGGFTVTGGTWADALDTNDGDTSRAHFCCSSPGQTFYVDMDDPALAGVTIQDLTIHVYARYVDGNSPSPPVITGTLDIGYRTGTATIWKGSTATDASGNYNLISSDTYNLDSDSGPLDLADITNLQIAVKRNTSGSAQLRVTEIYVEVTYLPSEDDTDPPTLSNQNPANGATNIAVDSDLTFTLADSGYGVDWTTFSIQLSGDEGYARIYTDADTSVVSNTGSPASYNVTVNPDADFAYEEVITAVVNVDDAAGNALVSPTWSFTTAAAATPQTIILHPSDLGSNPGGYWTVPTADQWPTYLDSNDGDTTYVTSNTGSQGAIFYMDVDDPGGLGSVIIQSLTYHVYARYVSGWSPSPPPYPGLVDIGYQTGTNTVWLGDTSIDDSGNYNLISSSTYTTDSDGGPLDLTDIDNLQIAVRRRTSGGYPLRVTEIYAEIVYSPQTQGQVSVPTEGAQETVYLPIIIKETAQETTP